MGWCLTGLHSDAMDRSSQPARKYPRRPAKSGLVVGFTCLAQSLGSVIPTAHPCRSNTSCDLAHHSCCTCRNDMSLCSACIRLSEDALAPSNRQSSCCHRSWACPNARERLCKLHRVVSDALLSASIGSTFKTELTDKNSLLVSASSESIMALPCTLLVSHETTTSLSSNG